jgi:hypothetical protein
MGQRTEANRCWQYHRCGSLIDDTGEATAMHASSPDAEGDELPVSVAAPNPSER